MAGPRIRRYATAGFAHPDLFRNGSRLLANRWHHPKGGNSLHRDIGLNHRFDTRATAAEAFRYGSCHCQKS